MKKRWSDSGVTFLEIIIALAILAIIVGPFMSAFVFSERGTVEAGQVLDAAFTAQRRLEQLSALDFRAAVDAGNRVREPFEGAFVEVEAVPYHTSNPHIPHVFNLVVQDTAGRNLFIATPTGDEVRSIGSITSPVSITIAITATGYTVTVPGASPPTLTGTLTAGRALILFNAARYTLSHNATLTVATSGGRAADVRVYDTFANSARIRVLGVTPEPPRRTGFTNRNFSMLRARVSVFDAATAVSPTAIMESIFELPN